MAHEEQLEKLTEVFDLYEDISEELEDEKFGPITLMKAFEPQETSFPTIFRTERQVNREELGECAEKTNMRLQMEHPNIMQMLDYSYRPMDEAASLFVFAGFYEKSETDLMQEIRYRDEMKKTFSDLEIYTIVKEVVGGLAYLQENGLVHGDIRPEYIMMNAAPEDPEEEPLDVDEGPKFAYKIADRLGMAVSPEQIQIINIREGKSLYLSPFLFDSYMNEAEAIKINPFRVDVFAVGMIVLQCGLLMETSDFYDFENMSFNLELLEQAKEQFKETYEDPILVDLIDLLLETEESNRVTPRSLMSKLNQIIEGLEDDADEGQEIEGREEAEVEAETESEEESESEEEESESESEEKEDEVKDSKEHSDFEGKEGTPRSDLKGESDSKDALERHVEKRIQEVEVPKFEENVEEIEGVMIGDLNVEDEGLDIEEDNGSLEEQEPEPEQDSVKDSVKDSEQEPEQEPEQEQEPLEVEVEEVEVEVEVEEVEEVEETREPEPEPTHSEAEDEGSEVSEDIPAIEDSPKEEARSELEDQIENGEIQEDIKDFVEGLVEGVMDEQEDNIEEEGVGVEEQNEEEDAGVVRESEKQESSEEEPQDEGAGILKDEPEDKEETESRAGEVQNEEDSKAENSNIENVPLEIEEGEDQPIEESEVINVDQDNIRNREESAAEDPEEDKESVAAEEIEFEMAPAGQTVELQIQAAPEPESQSENEIESARAQPVVLENKDEDEESQEIQEEIICEIGVDVDIEEEEEEEGFVAMTMGIVKRVANTVLGKAVPDEIKRINPSEEQSEDVIELEIQDETQDIDNTVEEIEIAQAQPEIEIQSDEDPEPVQEIEIEEPEVPVKSEDSAPEDNSQNQEEAFEKSESLEPIEVEEIEQVEETENVEEQVEPVEKKGLFNSIIGKIDETTDRLLGMLPIPMKEEEGQSEYDDVSDSCHSEVEELSIPDELEKEEVQEIPIQENGGENEEEQNQIEEIAIKRQVSVEDLDYGVLEAMKNNVQKFLESKEESEIEAEMVEEQIIEVELTPEEVNEFEAIMTQENIQQEDDSDLQQKEKSESHESNEDQSEQASQESNPQPAATQPDLEPQQDSARIEHEDVPFTPEIAGRIKDEIEILAAKNEFEQNYQNQNINPEIDCRHLIDLEAQRQMEEQNEANRQQHYEGEAGSELERIKRKYNMNGNYHQDDERLYHDPEVAVNEIDEIREKHEWEQTTKTLLKTNPQITPAGETQENLEFEMTDDSFAPIFKARVEEANVEGQAVEIDLQPVDSYVSNQEFNRAEIRNFGPNYDTEDTQLEMVTGSQPTTLEQRQAMIDNAPVHIQQQEQPIELKIFAKVQNREVKSSVGRVGQQPIDKPSEGVYHGDEMEEVCEDISGPWKQNRFNPAECKAAPKPNTTYQPEQHTESPQQLKKETYAGQKLVQQMEDVVQGVKQFLSSTLQGTTQGTTRPAPVNNQQYKSVGGVYSNGQVAYPQPPVQNRGYYQVERTSYNPPRELIQRVSHGSYHSPQITKKIMEPRGYQGLSRPQNAVLNPQNEYYTSDHQQNILHSNIVSHTPQRDYERKTQERKVSNEINFNSFSKKRTAEMNIIEGDRRVEIRPSQNSRNQYSTPSRGYPPVQISDKKFVPVSPNVQYTSQNNQNRNFKEGSLNSRNQRTSVTPNHEVRRSNNRSSQIPIKQTRATTPNMSTNVPNSMKNSTAFTMFRKPNGKIRVSYELSNSGYKNRDNLKKFQSSQFTESLVQNQHPIFSTSAIRSETKHRSVQTHPRVTRVSISKIANNGVSVIVDNANTLVSKLLSNAEGFAERQVQSGDNKMVKVIRYSQREPTKVANTGSNYQVIKAPFKPESYTKHEISKATYVPKSPRKEHIYESIIIPNTTIEKSLPKDQNIKVSITVNNGNAAIYNAYPGNVVRSQVNAQSQLPNISEYKSAPRKVENTYSNLKNTVTLRRRINLSNYHSKGLSSTRSMTRKYQTNVPGGSRYTESRVQAQRNIEQKYASVGGQGRRHITSSDNKQNRL